VLLRERWAPIGVARFLKMVLQNGYFLTTIPLFRCTDAASHQFGLSEDPAATKLYANKRLPDDPLWLPPGKELCQNEASVRWYLQQSF
jgi:hypothetical protein